jgi:hypothetical protein
VHAQIDAVEQRAREPPAVALDLLRKAAALPLVVAPVAARTSVRIRRGNEASNSSWRRQFPNSADAGAHDESPRRTRPWTPADNRRTLKGLSVGGPAQSRGARSLADDDHSGELLREWLEDQEQRR